MTLRHALMGLSAHDQLHIACAEGKLVTLAAAPSATQPTRTLDIGIDARDVLVRDDKLFITRFRAAQLMILNADGVLQETRTPVTFRHDEEHAVLSEPNEQGACTFGTEITHIETTPNVAWRALDVPKVGVTMLHQRSHTEAIQTSAGGYGRGSRCGGGIVKTSLTNGLDTDASATVDLANSVLGVDMAVDPAGEMAAVVSPGNYGGIAQIELLNVQQLTPSFTEPADSDVAQLGQAPCIGGTTLPEPPGQATAVTFVSAQVLAVQQREPAAISFYDVSTNSARGSVALSAASTSDTGHTLFHMRAGAGVACASCHPEAGDDGHVWTFEDIGPRRTQTLRGGLLGTEPFHWNGDMTDFPTLVKEVFVRRMSGFQPTDQQSTALAKWLDRQPALHADSTDKAAADRGKLLFESAEIGCSTCHSGAHLTNNQIANVNTGADLQVPSLKGVRFRAPLMHDGCAADIHERLTHPTCGGGDAHGKTSQLHATDIQDLAAYLETL